MKHECGMIQDLLPLYFEGLASDESKKTVDEHVQECAKCKKELDTLRKTQADLPAAALPMKKISRGIRKRRRMSILLVSCLLLALAVAFGAFVTDRQYLSYEKDQLSILKSEDFLIINTKHPDVFLEIDKTPSSDQPNTAQYEVSIYTRRFDTIDRSDMPMWMQMLDSGKGQGNNPFPAQAVIELDDDKEAVVYYVKADELSVLLYGRDLFPHGGYMILPRLALAYYLIMALTLTVLFSILFFLLRRKTKGKGIAQMLLGLPLSYILGHLLIKGFSTMSYYSLLRDFLWIIACSAFLYAAWLLMMREMREKVEG